MRLPTPRWAAFLACFLCAAALAQDASGRRRPPTGTVTVEGASDATVPPKTELIKLLQDNGFSIDKDRALIQTATKVKIDRSLMEKAGFLYSGGDLVYKASGQPIEREILPKVLAGLLPFAEAKGLSPEEVGRTLQKWGVPEAFDGEHLLNPDGSATYFGLMFYEGMRKNPGAVSSLSGERLAKSLELFDSAYEQAFQHGAPDLGSPDLARAWAMLTWKELAPGETPIALRPGANAAETLRAYRDQARAAQLKTGDQATKDELAKAVSTLNVLEKYRYHRDRSLDATLPEPPNPANQRALKLYQAKLDAVLDPAPPPTQSLLAPLLRAVDKLNGKPLSPQEQEWLIKSFPMGETVWRMGVAQLWRDGITGKGVKVGVIDTGVARNEDLGDSVKARENFTFERGPGLDGDHATHVTGTILGLAPDAEIRSYKAISDGGSRENERLASSGDQTERQVLAAVDKAVADGNQIINMSLGGSGSPSDELVKKINQYAEKGVIFVIAAGNSGATGVSQPSVAEKAFTSGALDVNDRMTTFSSYGDVFDPTKLAYAIKKVFMAPGDNIVSLKAPDELDKRPYGKMSGTSMAAPHNTGVLTLMWQLARQVNGLADPVQASQAAQNAVEKTARPIPRNQLPSGVPPDQEFVIVDPPAAYEQLRSRSLVGSN